MCGHVYVVFTTLTKPPKDKIVLCICDEKNLFVWFNTKAQRHGAGQLKCAAGDHTALTRDCYLDLSRVTTFQPHEIANAKPPHILWGSTIVVAAAALAAWRCWPRSAAPRRGRISDPPGSHDYWETGLRLCQTFRRPAWRNRKYFRTNSPSRAASGPPQTRHAISPSLVVSDPASARTT
jgi:hypothetical protein